MTKKKRSTAAIRITSIEGPRRVTLGKSMTAKQYADVRSSLITPTSKVGKSRYS